MKALIPLVALVCMKSASALDVPRWISDFDADVPVTLVPAPEVIENSPVRSGHLPLYRGLMAGGPMRATWRAGVLEERLRTSPGALELAMLAASLSGVEVFRPRAPISSESSSDVAAALLRLGVDQPAPDVGAALARPLVQLLHAIYLAERFRQRAFARIDPELTPERLMRQAVSGRFEPFEEPDYRSELAHGRVEMAALHAGFQGLVGAVEDVSTVLASEVLPKLSWRVETPLGEILIDTTEGDIEVEITDPLLVIRRGGDDRYRFRSTLDKTRGRISILIDSGGRDTFESLDPSACPSAALLGYGILFADGKDDKVFSGGQLVQAAALFGAAILRSGQGSDRFEAQSHAQGFALGGVAILDDLGGDSRFAALSLAQGSAGPHAVAVLRNRDGNDVYRLGGAPVRFPSSQLPDRNVSLGQGAGFGLRADHSDGRALAGGIGILADFAGHDTYVAEVFAQAAGYYDGVGILLDGGGDDTFEAAWYAQGAAAHRGIGLLLSRSGDDRYRATHATSLAAAHDFSLAVFVDESGNDRYEGAGLAFGAGHDNGVAIFLDIAGDDEYHWRGKGCAAFGVARLDRGGGVREGLPNAGYFFDLGGWDVYPPQCDGPGDNVHWQDAGAHGEIATGSGTDGDYSGKLMHRSARKATGVQ